MRSVENAALGARCSVLGGEGTGLRPAEHRAPSTEHRSEATIRVLFVFAWVVVGGEETEVRLLARNLDPRRYELEVLSTYRRPNMPSQSHEQLEALGVPVDTACYGLPPEEHPPHIARRIREGRFDVVVACQGVRPIYPAYDLLDAPPALVEHGGLVSEVFHNPKHHTTAYVGVCREIRDAAAAVLACPDDAYEIPSMVDLSEFRPGDRESARTELGVAPDEPLVGWVGRLDPKKRVEDFVDACALLARAQPQARFLVIGGPDAFHPEYAEGLRCRAVELGLDGRLTFTGDRPDVPRLLAGLDAFVWLSRGEGMPHVIAEAGAAGIPVVATRDGGTPQQIRDGVSGLFVPHESPAEVAAAIARLLDDPALRACLGRALREHVVRSYSAEVVVPQWEALLQRLAARTQHAARGTHPAAGVVARRQPARPWG
jgi:polysaccharide biosynthesis protein PelF